MITDLCICSSLTNDSEGLRGLLLYYGSGTTTSTNCILPHWNVSHRTVLLLVYSTYHNYAQNIISLSFISMKIAPHTMPGPGRPWRREAFKKSKKWLIGLLFLWRYYGLSDTKRHNTPYTFDWAIDLLTFNVTEAYYFGATIYCKIERQEHVNCMKSGILLSSSWCPVLQLRWKHITNFEWLEFCVVP